jgi:hypothetical protein
MKRRRCLGETDPVIAKVRLRFGRIPLSRSMPAVYARREAAPTRSRERSEAAGTEARLPSAVRRPEAANDFRVRGAGRSRKPARPENMARPASP